MPGNLAAVESTLGEVWKAVYGWPYEVSSFGRVRRVKAGGNRASVGRCLRQIIKANGYCVVSLYRAQRVDSGDRRKWNSEGHQFSVHRLVMEAFYGPCPQGLQVNHRDGDKTHNRLSNLEYVTNTGNMLHAYREGLRNARGEHNGQAVLNRIKVIEIRRLIKAGANVDAVADQFNVSRYTIKHVVKRTRWGHIP